MGGGVRGGVDMQVTEGELVTVDLGGPWRRSP